MSDTAPQAEGKGSESTTEALIQELLARVTALEADSAHRDGLFGRQIFIADTSAGDGTFQVVHPDGPGSTNVTNIVGFSADGTNAADCPLLKLPANIQAIIPFRTGTARAYFPLHQRVVKFGKINQVIDCGTSVVVYETDSGGNVIEPQRDVTVQISWSGCTAYGMCLEIDQVIAFIEADPPDTLAFMVNPYKSFGMGLVCAEEASASSPDVTRIEVYPGDIFLNVGADCINSDDEEKGTGRASIFGRGVVVKKYPYTSGSSTGDIGFPTAEGTGGVKVFNFDIDNHPSGATFGSDYARIAFDVSGGTTTANAPYLGGATCVDLSLPLQATIIGYYPTGVTIDASQPITIGVDTNTCEVSLTYATMKTLIPWP